MADIELLHAIGQLLDVKLQPVHERLDRMDERLDGIDERLDRMDERLDGIDERLDRMDERLDGIDERLDRMDERSRAVCPQALILLQPRTLPSELSRVMTALITMMFENINLSEFIRTSQTLIWLDGKYVGKSSIYARINRICRNRLFKMPQNHVRGPVSCHQNLPVRTQT